MAPAGGPGGSSRIAGGRPPLFPPPPAASLREPLAAQESGLWSPPHCAALGWELGGRSLGSGPRAQPRGTPRSPCRCWPWASGPAPSSPAPRLTPQLSEQKSAEALSRSTFPVCHPFSPSAWKDLPLHPGCWYLRGRCLLSATLHYAFLRAPPLQPSQPPARAPCPVLFHQWCPGGLLPLLQLPWWHSRLTEAGGTSHCGSDSLP